MRDYLFLRRPTTFSSPLATTLIVFAVLIPCLFGILFAAREGVRLHDSVAELLTAMETSGEGALATLLPEHIVERVRPWIQRYLALHAGGRPARPGRSGRRHGGLRPEAYLDLRRGEDSLENYRLMWRAWTGGAHEVRAALAEE